MNRKAVDQDQRDGARINVNTPTGRLPARRHDPCLRVHRDPIERFGALPAWSPRESRLRGTAAMET